MYGPEPPGHWTKTLGTPRNFQMLEAGRRYRVIKNFRDYDGDEHPIGEMWTYLGYSFAPHDDGVSIFVAIRSDEWHIRLQWRKEEQADIIDALASYLSLVKAG